MKICYFADGQSIHTQKWCIYFANLGHELHLITFRDCRIDRVHVHFLNVGTIATAGGNWRTLFCFILIAVMSSSLMYFLLFYLFLSIGLFIENTIRKSN
jgi:hypothetical protein